MAVDPNKSWHIKTQAGKIEGPFSDNQILQWAREGKLSLAVKLKHPDRTGGEWLLARDVVALKAIISQSTGSRTSPPTIDLPDDPSALGENLPNWRPPESTPSTNTPEGSNYWNNVSKSLATPSKKPEKKNKQAPRVQEENTDSGNSDSLEPVRRILMLILGAVALGAIAFGMTLFFDAGIFTNGLSGFSQGSLALGRMFICIVVPALFLAFLVWARNQMF